MSRKSWGVKERAETTGFTKFTLGDEVRIRVLDEEPPVWLPTHRIDLTGGDRRTIYVPCLDEPGCSQIRLTTGQVLHEMGTLGKRWAIRIWNFNTGQAEVLNQGARIFKGLESINDDPDQPEIQEIDIKISCVPSNSAAYAHDFEVHPMVKSRLVTDEMRAAVLALAIKKPTKADVVAQLVAEGMLKPPTKAAAAAPSKTLPAVVEEEDVPPVQETFPVEEDPFADPDEVAKTIADLLKE